MIILGRHSGDARPDAGISGGKKMERKGMAAADGPAEREKMKGFVLAGVEDARYMTLEYAEALRKMDVIWKWTKTDIFGFIVKEKKHNIAHTR